MMNQYETVFIVTPVLSEDQMKEAVKKFSAYLKENSAEIVHEDNWGLRKLAYPIQKKSTGFYHLIEFKCEGDLIQRMETEFRRDERIIRFLTMRMDKFAIKYAIMRRKKMADQAKTEKVEEKNGK